MAKIVKDCLKYWKEMDGSSNEEKRINAYLCNIWITRYDTPSDECISYAKKLSQLTNPKKEVSKVKKILEPLYSYTDKNENVRFHPEEAIVDNLVAKTVEFLLLIKES